MSKIKISEITPLTEQQIKDMQVSVTTEIKTVKSVAIAIYGSEVNSKDLLYSDVSHGRIDLSNKVINIDNDRFIYVPEKDQEKDKWNFIKVLKKAGRPKK